MKIVAIELKLIAHDQSIVTITTDVDYRGKPSNPDSPAVMQQLPTAVALELKAAWEMAEKERKLREADALFQSLPRM